jgi:murein DD-endopeptidase MepM/ murein hydrolase activator NlpD
MPRTPKIAALASVLAAAVLGAAALAAVAQTSAEEPPLEATPGDTTTTTSPPLIDPFATTTTTITASEPPPTTPPTSTPPAEGGGDGVVPPGTPQTVPPEYQNLINSVKRSRANNTGKLLAALRPLLDLGLTEAEVAAIGFGQFPVAGYATFSDDWWNPRFVPTFHLHEGTDIFAAHGTPVRAPFDGVLRLSNGPVGGLASYVTADDGTYAYMSHLSAYPDGLATGQRVKRGDIVGFNGDSGNARGGSPHVHFEIHPAPTKEVVTGRGRNRTVQVVTRPVRPGTVLPPTNPKPYLDKWIADAMAQVPSVIAQYEANRPRAVIATGLTRQFGDGGGQFAFRSTPPLDQLMWVSSASPSGGALQVAQAHAARAASGLDWEAEARRAERRADAWRLADRRARAALVLLAPAPLVEMLGWEEASP